MLQTNGLTGSHRPGLFIASCWFAQMEGIWFSLGVTECPRRLLFCSYSPSDSFWSPALPPRQRLTALAQA